MTIEDIKYLIEELIKFTALAVNKRGVTRGMLGKIYEGHAIDARDNLLEAIKQYKEQK